MCFVHPVCQSLTVIWIRIKSLTLLFAYFYTFQDRFSYDVYVRTDIKAEQSKWFDQHMVTQKCGFISRYSHSWKGTTWNLELSFENIFSGMIQPQEMETLQNLFLNGMTPPGKLKKRIFLKLAIIKLPRIVCQEDYTLLEITRQW